MLWFTGVTVWGMLGERLPHLPHAAMWKKCSCFEARKALIVLKSSFHCCGQMPWPAWVCLLWEQNCPLVQWWQWVGHFNLQYVTMTSCFSSVANCHFAIFPARGVSFDLFLPTFCCGVPSPVVFPQTCTCIYLSLEIWETVGFLLGEACNVRLDPGPYWPFFFFLALLPLEFLKNFSPVLTLNQQN